MKLYPSYITIGILIFSGYIIYLHRNSFNTEHAYVTSEACQDCHTINYESWKNNTLHPHMFRPKQSDSEILGDFSSADPVLTFQKKDVEFILGNKWEQVYARIIDGEYYPLPAKWLIVKKEWVAYLADSWKETPMSKKCNGCHTTGFDPVTLEFSEYGIGCEACHGPGGKHVQNEQMKTDLSCNYCHKADANQTESESDIIRSYSATVCGQCHNRGQSIPKDELHGAIFDFPVKYKPGIDLNTAMEAMTPEKDTEGKFFWGNGIAKNLHQEYGDWSKSKHANAVIKLKENYIGGGDRGVLSDKCLHCHSTDYRLADNKNKPTLNTAKHGVTCVACHEPHGRDKLLPHTGDGVTLCGGCHIDSMSHSVAKKGKPHYPCPQSNVTCVDCHMPKIVEIGGIFSIRNHGYNIITPTVAKQNDMPSSCQNAGCHKDKTVEWAIDAFQSYYEQ